MGMLERYDELRAKLKDKAKMSDSFDPLYEYRRWWDIQKIKSEGDDGWPLPFCFDDENIQKFADYWIGPTMEKEESLDTKIVIPSPKRNIAVRLFISPVVWIGNRQEILEILEKMKKLYKMAVRIDE